MSAPAREAAKNYSNGTRAAVAAAALLGGLLLAVSEALPLFSVEAGGDIRTEAGYENHAFAMLLLGVAAVPMALAAARGSRPAMAALLVLGAAALVIALTVDLPAASNEGSAREAITSAEVRAEPASGFFVETLGAVLLVAGGGGLLLAGGRRRGAAAEVT